MFKFFSLPPLNHLYLLSEPHQFPRLWDDLYFVKSTTLMAFPITKSSSPIFRWFSLQSYTYIQLFTVKVELPAIPTTDRWGVTPRARLLDQVIVALYARIGFKNRISFLKVFET